MLADQRENANLHHAIARKWGIPDGTIVKVRLEIGVTMRDKSSKMCEGS